MTKEEMKKRIVLLVCLGLLAVGLVVVLVFLFTGKSKAEESTSETSPVVSESSESSGAEDETTEVSEEGRGTVTTDADGEVILPEDTFASETTGSGSGSQSSQTTGTSSGTIPPSSTKSRTTAATTSSSSQQPTQPRTSAPATQSTEPTKAPATTAAPKPTQPTTSSGSSLRTNDKGEIVLPVVPIHK